MHLAHFTFCPALKRPKSRGCVGTKPDLTLVRPYPGTTLPYGPNLSQPLPYPIARLRLVHKGGGSPGSITFIVHDKFGLVKIAEHTLPPGHREHGIHDITLRPS